MATFDIYISCKLKFRVEQFCFSDEGSCMATNQLEKGQLRSQLYKRPLEVSYSHFNYVVVVM